MPQSSMLGHLLFLILIKNLSLSLLEGLTQLSLFANNATYFVSNKNVKTIETYLQKQYSVMVSLKSYGHKCRRNKSYVVWHTPKTDFNE